MPFDYWNLVWHSEHHLNTRPVFEWWFEYRTSEYWIRKSPLFRCLVLRSALYLDIKIFVFRFQGTKYGQLDMIDFTRINPDIMPPVSDPSKLWNVQVTNFKLLSVCYLTLFEPIHKTGQPLSIKLCFFSFQLFRSITDDSAKFNTDYAQQLNSKKGKTSNDIIAGVTDSGYN